jgi:gas vesicle protein
MRNIGINSRSKNTVKDWVRLAAKVGLLFTEPKVRAAVGSQIKDTVDDLTDKAASRYDDVSDAVASKYEDAVDRLEDAAAAIQGKSYWASRVTGFLLGVGVGAGLGILLAPASGAETRESVRDTAVDVTNRIRRSVTKMPSTGTEG